MVDLLTIPLVHTGGVSRLLYTSKYWEPSNSEGELEEEEEAEVEIVQHENVIVLTPLQAEELVPRAKLWVPTSKAKASARAAQGFHRVYLCHLLLFRLSILCASFILRLGV